MVNQICTDQYVSQSLWMNVSIKILAHLTKIDRLGSNFRIVSLSQCSQSEPNQPRNLVDKFNLRLRKYSRWIEKILDEFQMIIGPNPNFLFEVLKQFEQNL